MTTGWVCGGHDGGHDMTSSRLWDYIIKTAGVANFGTLCYKLSVITQWADKVKAQEEVIHTMESTHQAEADKLRFEISSLEKDRDEQQHDVSIGLPHITVCLNSSYNADIFVYKLRRPKDFFYLKSS